MLHRVGRAVRHRHREQLDRARWTTWASATRRCTSSTRTSSMASSQLVGSRGACASWIGYGPTIQPFGGLSHLWNVRRRRHASRQSGDPPRSPRRPSLRDRRAARACMPRDTTGGGVHSEIAQVEGHHRQHRRPARRRNRSRPARCGPRATTTSAARRGVSSAAPASRRGRSSACATTATGRRSSRRWAARRGRATRGSRRSTAARPCAARSTTSSPSGRRR